MCVLQFFERTSAVCLRPCALDLDKLTPTEHPFCSSPNASRVRLCGITRESIKVWAGLYRYITCIQHRGDVYWGWWKTNRDDTVIPSSTVLIATIKMAVFCCRRRSERVPLFFPHSRSLVNYSNHVHESPFVYRRIFGTRFRVAICPPNGYTTDTHVCESSFAQRRMFGTCS